MKLTQEEKRIKLAEAAGWRLFSSFANLWAPPKHVVEYDCDAYPLPDYFNDLNAVHELEQIVKKVWGKYVKILNSITDPACATAAQRCEALGKTLNLW
jgi:hypothetical protein